MRSNTKGFGMLLVLAIIAFVLVTLTGFYLINSKKQLNLKKDVEVENVMEVDDESEVESIVNEDSDEEMTPVSDGSSFDSIESDLDGTVILEEDFSDL